MRELTHIESNKVSGASVCDVLVLGTAGLWVGSSISFCCLSGPFGPCAAVGGGILGGAIGAYLGQDVKLKSLS
jgi:hypothetical protein